MILIPVLFTISWFIARRIYRKVGSKYVALFYALSVYIILAFVSLELLDILFTSQSSSVAFLVSIIISTLHIFILPDLLFKSVFILAALLVISLHRSTQIKVPVSYLKYHSRLFYVIVTLGVLVSVYTLNLFYYPATFLRQPVLCNLIYDNITYLSHVQAECFVRAISDRNYTDPEDQESTFIKNKLSYYSILSLLDIGGKLAYLSVGKLDNGRTSEIVYDGSAISLKYKKVGTFVGVGESIAYEAFDGKKKFIVFNGEEIGKQYSEASRPMNLDGKLAYYAQLDQKQFLVYDNKEYGKEFDHAHNPSLIDGSFAYIGTLDEHKYVVVDGKRFSGPYLTIESYTYEGGHFLVKAIRQGDSSNVLIVDNKEYEKTGQDILEYSFIGDKLAYSSVNSDRNVTIFFEGKEFAAKKVLSNDMRKSFFKIKDDIGYVVKNSNSQAEQLYISGNPIGKEYPSIHEMAVSKDGKVALVVERDGINGIVFDGEEVFWGTELGELEFFGERLGFTGKEKNVRFFWYDGKKVQKDMEAYMYPTLVAGKLFMVGANYNPSEYYIIREP